MSQLERNIYDALRFFGVLNAQELQQKLAMRGIEVTEEEMHGAAHGVIGKRLAKFSDVPGHYKGL